MKRIVGLVVLLGIGLFVLAACGQSTASEKQLSKSDNIFETGKVYKIGNSNEKTSFFEVEQKEKNILTVYDLENDRKSYEVPYETEKMENGYLLYKFDGPRINDDPLFYNGAYGETEDYYLVNIDDNDLYYFISETFLEKKGGNLNDSETIKEIKKSIDKFGRTKLELTK